MAAAKTQFFKMSDGQLHDEALRLTHEEIAGLSRDQIKEYLRVLGVFYDNKDNTSRLKNLLQATIEGFQSPLQASSAESLMSVVQLLQQQLKLQEDRYQRDQERRDRELAALFECISPQSEGDTTSDDRRSRGNMAKISIRPPDILEDGTTLKVFKKWEASWRNYAQVAKLNEKSREDQVATFWTFCKPEFLQRIRHAVEIPLDTPLTLDQVLQKVKDYLKSQRNIAVDRYKLVRRKQETGESFDDFLVELREQAEDANLSSMTADEWIATLIVSGVRDEDTRQELLSKKPPLDLPETITLCRNRELAEKEDQRLSKGVSLNVNKVKPRDRSRSQNRFHKAGREERKCRKCGFPVHDKGKSCPADGKFCCFCKRKGHFGRMCENRKSGSGKQIGNVCKGLDKRPVLPVDIYLPNGEFLANIPVIADTGAETTAAGTSVMKKLLVNADDLDKCDEHLESANMQLDAIGQTDLIIKCNGMDCLENVTFCRDLRHNEMYLSFEACKKLGLVPKDFPLHIKSVCALESISDESISIDLEKFLKNYSEVFNKEGPLKIMKCEPMKIELKENAVPFAVYAARPVSYPLRETVKMELDSMLEQGIIERVGDRPTQWCHPIVVIPKQDGGVRMTVDLTKLNSQVLRTVHNAKTPWDAVREVVQGAKFFTVCDAVKGYWQLELHEDSRDLTTFLTPWGRFRYRRAPMGFISTGDSYNYQGDLAIDGLERTIKVVDDVLIASRTREEHLRDVKAFLDRCLEHGITLNLKKLKFCQESVKFAGFVLSGEGISADPKKICAITEFPKPTNITELRSFMGMVNQLGSFSPHISEKCVPLRELLKTKNDFVWLSVHDEAFNEVKKLLINPPILVHFDPSRETRIETDASRLKGFGFSLLQRHGDLWKLVSCGSRFLTDVETRYSMIELEAIAIKYALIKCKVYLSGLPCFTVITDHRPLVSIFNKYSLTQVENLKLQNLKAELQSQFQFVVEWRKGKNHVIADCLSRAPVEIPEESQDDIQKEVVTAIMVANISEGATNEAEIVDLQLERLKNAAEEDSDYMELVNAVKNDSIGQDNALPCVKQYKGIRHNLAIDGNLVLYGQRIIVPKSQRQEVLRGLHAAHQGITRTKQRARMCVYWPGITNDITQMLEKCEVCQSHQPSLSKETLKADPLPNLPFESVSADLFYCKGRHFLVYVDRLSGYPMVHEWKDDPSSKQVIKAMSKMMSVMGKPHRIRTDGGPQFMARDFKDFLKRKDIEWSPSSPHFPSSNGHAEAFVKKIKTLLIKLDCSTTDERFHEAILELRNTPREDGITPNQIVFGRSIRSKVPMHPSAFKPKDVNFEDIQQKKNDCTENVKKWYNLSAKDLVKFEIGDKVRIQDPKSNIWDKIGEIVHVGNRGRCYYVKLFSNGKLWWRNRRFLRKYHEPNESVCSSNEVDDECSPMLRRSKRERRKTVRFSV